jgi:UDP-N-acetylglucosamine transferase subunit ALG13
VSDASRPLVVCLVGTDHHQFERLVSWCDNLATSRPDVDVFVQHGLSSAPRVAKGQAFLEKADLERLVQRAQVAVSHGGPALISEIRAAGLRPIAVPRDPDRDEHVDRHQIRFLDRLAADGLVDVVFDERSFVDSVTRRLAHPFYGRVDRDADEARVLGSVERFAGLVEDLFDSPSPAPSQPDRRRTGIHQA